MLTTMAAGVGIAAEATGGKTQLEAPPPKPGADGWYDARATDDSFVVRVPAAFQAFSEDSKSESGAAMRTVGVRVNKVAAFGGKTSYLASCIIQKGDARTQQQRLENIVAQWEQKGMMRFRRPIELGPTPGIEFEMADDVKVIRARAYAPKAGTCTVLVSWPPYDALDEAVVAKYLDSFKLTK